ncbi:hypothetical protein [Rathayibacter sp. Leaf248]|uniref:hypothetical protein n=1 Tax=Rathayibacter sp. Leaf248 TaxID=2876555 RepID=UPI001E3CAB95|nr:hypothetical protein [Rathayibacter sp. Leaf248]
MVDTKLTKSAGEHWVCSMLSRLGWAVALTRDGLERTDILAVQTTGERRVVEIQVKTANNTGPNTSWPITTKSRSIALTDREWFVFVWLPAERLAAPRAFVVPREVVSAAAWIQHQAWLTDPLVPTGKRNAPIDRARVSMPTWAGYEDRWDLLEAPTDHAPVLLPPVMRAQSLLDRVGLPPGHPWEVDLPDW